MATTKQILGKVVITNKSEYNPSTVYEILDVVSYQGSSYISKVYDNNSLPTNDTKWQLLAQKGDTYKVSEADIENIANQITENANSNFNRNVSEKTETFNSNAKTKTDEFNSNANTTVSAYNVNADKKLKEYNDNDTVKLKEYNDNATSSVDNYNTNASTKLNEYNTNSDTKLKEYNDNASQKINEYNEHSKELDDKIDSTRKELDRVKNEILDQGEANGSYIHLEDSAMAELQDLSVDGVLKQETTKGYNLVKLKTSQSDAYTYSNGIYTTRELKKNYDGIEINHDNIPLTANDVFYYSANIRVKSGTPARINVISSAINKYTKEYIQNPTLTNEYQKIICKLTINEDVNYNTGIYFQIGVIQDNIILEITDVMITKENPINLPYEKFTGGQPSPNTNFEQPIKVLTGNQKLTSCNKNLFNKNDFNVLEGYYIGTKGNVGQATTNSIIYMPIKSNTSYSIQKISSNKFRVGTYSNLEVLGKILNNVIKNLDDSITSYVLNNNNDKYLFFQFLGGDTNEQEILDSIQIEEGSIPTQLVEHQESSVTFDIPEDEFVGYINDTYKDELSVVYNEEGQFHKILKKKVGKLVITDENKNKFIESMNNSFKIPAVLISKEKIGWKASWDENMVKSNRYSQITAVSEVYDSKISSNITNQYIIIFDERFTDLQTARNLLVGTEIYIALANEYEIDLGVCEMPITYNEITNIFTDSDLLPQINIKYYRNFTKTIQNLQINNDTLKNELTSIEDRLTALENANITAESEVSE